VAPDPDPPPLLAPRSEQGYVSHPSMALNREPEAVDQETQDWISIQARTRFAETRADELARADSKRWCNRLKNVEMRARSKHVDIHKWQIEVRRAVAAMEEAVEGAP
jgi:hypothetical protein